MKNNDRIEKVKKGLDNDVYKKINDLEQLKDETISSTEKLADILDGYVTKVENMGIEEEVDDLIILEEKEIELEVEEDLLNEYSNQVHFGNDTLEDLLKNDQPDFSEVKEDTEEINKIINNIEDIEDLSSSDDLDNYTQTIVSPIEVDITEDLSLNTEEVEVKQEEKSETKQEEKSEIKQEDEKNESEEVDVEKKQKDERLDKILIIILVVLVAIFLFTLLII